MDEQAFSEGTDQEDEEEEWEDVGDDAPEINHANGVSGDLEIALTGAPSPQKRRRVQGSSKEARAEAVAVHQAHALCLLARGSSYDAAADCPCLQARLLSMLDVSVISHVEHGASAASTTGLAKDVSWLMPLVQWFHATFAYEPPPPLPTSGSAVEWRSVDLGAVSVVQQLQRCLDQRRGTADQIGALLVALLRAFGLLTRTVWHLEAVSPKALLSDKPNAMPTKLPARAPRSGSTASRRSSQPGSGRGRGRGRGAAGQAAATGAAVARAASAPAGTHAGGVINLASSDEADVGPAQPPSAGRRGKRAAPDASQQDGSGSNGKKKQRGKGGGKQAADEGAATASKLLHKSASDSQAVLAKQRSNRGEEEFEQQLAMAMAATAFQASQDAAVNKGSATPAGDAWKRSSLKRAGSAVNTGAPGASTSGQEGWLWSRRASAVPALRWAEVHIGNEASGRWVPVDGLRNCLDCPQRIEQCVPGGCQLLYVVAYQPGAPPKDVTKRYASDYTAVARQRMDDWWRDTLAGRNTAPGHGLSPEHALMLAMSGQAVPLAPPVKRRRSLPSTADTADHIGTAVGLQPLGSLASGNSSGAAGPSGTGGGDVDRLRAAQEDAELERKVSAQHQALPTTLDGFKSHPLYVLQRHLTKYQALRPGAKLLGLHRSEPYYSRADVHDLHTTDRWRREGRAVRKDEFGAPAKVVKKREMASKQRSSKGGSPFQQAAAQPAASGPEPTSELYGYWQTEAWRPAAAVDGKVPKNERGSVEVPPFAKELPAGTIHLDRAGLVPVCKELGIDFAPAMLGFDARGGAMVPVIRGVVVCEEHVDAVLLLHDKKEREREQKAAAKRWRTAEVAWTQLLQALWMRVKLERKYSGDSGVQAAGVDVQEAAQANTTVGAPPAAVAAKPARASRAAKGKQAPDTSPNGQQEASEQTAQTAAQQQAVAPAVQPGQTGSWLHMAEQVEEF